MLRILLVSPTPLYADAISLALQASQVDVRCIDSTQCVIETCQESRFSLIIFLSLAPYFTSMNIVEHLRNNLEAVPPIYVISHSHSQSTILTLLECGVNQYMTFPINIYRLRNKVHTLLSENELW